MLMEQCKLWFWSQLHRSVLSAVYFGPRTIQIEKWAKLNAELGNYNYYSNGMHAYLP